MQNGSDFSKKKKSSFLTVCFLSELHENSFVIHTHFDTFYASCTVIKHTYIQFSNHASKFEDPSELTAFTLYDLLL